MSSKLVVKDAVWQIAWRIVSSLCGFFVVKLISPYLWPLRYWDYGTILKFFAIWSARSDFGLYVIALRELWQIKERVKDNLVELKEKFWKYVWARVMSMTIVYVLALIVAYLIPSYTSNPYLVWWIPLWMIYSASVMAAWIQQLPLQIFWKMEKVSISLLWARFSQIIVLVIAVLIIFPIPNATSEIFWDLLSPATIQKINSIWLFPIAGFDWSKFAILAFVLIMFSVFISSLAQNIYVHFASKKYLPLKISFDRKFTLWIFWRNWKYWLSAWLSSFHTLIVLIFLSIRFPTSKGFTYTWIWTFALAFIEILLIIPTSLWNSMLHKITNYSTENKRRSFWNFMNLMFWIGGVLLINFLFFSDWFVKIVWWTKFLSDTLWHIWSEVVMPFLWIVLCLSFIKQVFNYIFVATENQNKLLWINLFWVLSWLAVWIFIIPKYNLWWWIIVQVLLEILFVLWAIWVAYKQKVMPKMSWKKIWAVIWLLIVSFFSWFLMLRYFPMTNVKIFLIEIVILNLFMIGLALPVIKKLWRWLTIEEAGEISAA